MKLQNMEVGQRYHYKNGRIKVNMEYLGYTTHGYPGFLIWTKTDPKPQMACYGEEWCERNLRQTK